MFKDLVGKTVKVYIDDMIIKSKKIEYHIVNIVDAFDVLDKVGMKLNSEKCTFRIKAEKFLGYLFAGFTTLQPRKCMNR